MTPHRRLTLIVAASALLCGCAHEPHVKLASMRMAPPQYYRTVGLAQPIPNADVEAQCVPPEGWKPEPLRKSERHTHQIWLSPTGKTAYGVIHFNLPLPVGVNIVHFEFLREMKKREGEAIELSQRTDPSLPGLRFVCEGGRYKMRVNLICNGFDGWAVYAGTFKGETPIPEELELAERARENTVLGLPERSQSAQSD
jgi:hypothetical protein